MSSSEIRYILNKHYKLKNWKILNVSAWTFHYSSQVLFSGRMETICNWTPRCSAKCSCLLGDSWIRLWALVSSASGCAWNSFCVSWCCQWLLSTLCWISTESPCGISFSHHYCKSHSWKCTYLLVQQFESLLTGSSSSFLVCAILPRSTSLLVVVGSNFVGHEKAIKNEIYKWV